MIFLGSFIPCYSHLWLAHPDTDNKTKFSENTMDYEKHLTNTKHTVVSVLL